VSAIDDFAPWQRRAYQQASEAIDAGRLAHGLLFCGPDRLGKRAVAEALAQRLLCLSPVAGEPCGDCRSCRLLRVRSQSDPPEMRPDGRLAHPFGHPGHPDLLLTGFEWNDKARPPRLRTEIVIEQIRELSEKLTLTPQYGSVRVAIVDPADAINHAASNALLKTLEEPVPGRYLWLISAHPARLAATIRSRCQKLEFRLPPREEALAWLRRQGHAGPVANEALEAARGHPGLADAWLRDGVLELRREVAGDLARLRRGESAVLGTAQRWTADEHAALRLRFAADLALTEAAGLTDPARTRSLAAWFDAANRTRELLRTTVRADLAVADLLLAWRGNDARAGSDG
jgi:DNA polymerase-3 subunit delta'